MNQEFAGKIADQLKAWGWAPRVEPRAVVALKTYETAVGPKKAVVHVYPSFDDPQTAVVSGDYQSEGRNIMSTAGPLVPVNADDETLARLMRRFALNADQAVAESYAGKLLRLGIKPH